MTTASLPDGGPGTAYDATVAAQGGSGDYQWSTPTADLPPGLSLAPGGQLTGTPTTAGSYSVPVTVSDPLTGDAPASADLTIDIVVAPTLSGDQPPSSVRAATTYIYPFTAGANSAPVTWSVQGPSWLSIGRTTGVLSGAVPAATGRFTYTITATPSELGYQPVSATYTIGVIWPQVVHGWPALTAGAPAGYRIGVTNNTWRLEVTAGTYSGTITLFGGALQAVSGIKLATGDSITLRGRTLTFVLHSAGAVTGLEFGCATAIMVAFDLDIDSQPATGSQVSLGTGATNAPAGTFTIGR